MSDALLLRVKIIAIAIALIASYAWGRHDANAANDAAATKAALSDARMVIEQQKTLNAAFKQAQEAQSNADANISALLEKNREDVQSIASGMSGDLGRLRKHFQCPSVPGSAAASGAVAGGDEASQGGLQGKDAEFLVRFAGQCDDTAIRLAESQATIKRLQALCRPDDPAK